MRTFANAFDASAAALAISSSFARRGPKLRPLPPKRERMFLSRHTVDFHLRQIFFKLGIRSRVELTRLVLEHDD